MCQVVCQGLTISILETPDMNLISQRSSVVEQLFRKQQVGSSILPVGSN